MLLLQTVPRPPYVSFWVFQYASFSQAEPSSVAWWWLNQLQEMHKPCHKGQQQESHSTLSGKYFKGMSKGRRWQLRTPMCAASSGEPEQPVRGISWHTGSDLLPPAPLWVPSHRSTSQNPCPACHFCSITSCSSHLHQTQEGTPGTHTQETCFPIC